MAATQLEYMVCSECGMMSYRQNDGEGWFHGTHTAEDFDSAIEMGFFDGAPPWEEIPRGYCCTSE